MHERYCLHTFFIAKSQIPSRKRADLFTGDKFCKMPFTNEDRVIIMHYRLDKNYGVKKLLKEFPDKNWTESGLKKLIKKIDETKSVARKKGSGRPKTGRTDQNIEDVEYLIQSQEGDEGSHSTQREIANCTGISKSTVGRIVIQDLKLKGYRKVKGQKLTPADKGKRVKRAKKLLSHLTISQLKKTFFTDEKLFKLADPCNVQNNRVYAPRGQKKNITEERLYVERQAFPKSVMISAVISKLGKMSIHFVEPGVKVNAHYYCNTLLNHLLPEMNQLSNGDYVFQQVGARAHTSTYSLAYLRDNVPELLEPDFWPPNSCYQNPLDYGIWGILQQVVYRERLSTMEDFKERIIQA